MRPLASLIRSAMPTARGAATPPSVQHTMNGPLERRRIARFTQMLESPGLTTGAALLTVALYRHRH